MPAAPVLPHRICDPRRRWNEASRLTTGGIGRETPDRIVRSCVEHIAELPKQNCHLPAADHQPAAFAFRMPDTARSSATPEVGLAHIAGRFEARDGFIIQAGRVSNSESRPARPRFAFHPGDEDSPESHGGPHAEPISTREMQRRVRVACCLLRSRFMMPLEACAAAEQFPQGKSRPDSGADIRRLSVGKVRWRASRATIRWRRFSAS